MNKRIGAAILTAVLTMALILTAVLTMALVPTAAFAYTGEEGSSSETGVIVREIPAEEVDETEETSAAGTTSTGSSGQKRKKHQQPVRLRPARRASPGISAMRMDPLPRAAVQPAAQGVPQPALPASAILKIFCLP